jgi:hypothetical protein
LAIVIGSLAAVPVLSDERAIETAVFRLELPRGWKGGGQGTPLRLRGPNSEVMLVTVAMPGAAGVDARIAKSQQFVGFWRDGIRKALVGGVLEKPGMKTVDPFTERKLQALPYFKARAQDEVHGIFLSGYGLIGRGGVVFLVTVEGRLKDKAGAEAAAERMLKGIVWKQ